MQLKDYYKTLELEPSASTQQVKKSFRQLALRYHPDKNPGNAVAEAMFREVQEAYETLIDPEKRETYHYKRWYNRSIKTAFEDAPLTPAGLLQQCLQLNEYMRGAQARGADFDALSYHIRQLLSERNIGIVQQFNDHNINAKIVHALLPPASALPFQYIAPVATLLQRVSGNNESLQQEIREFIDRQKQAYYWRRYGVMIVIAVTLTICWVIYMLAKL